MDLTETMKNVLTKGIQGEMTQTSNANANMGFPGQGYVTEKIYMLLQLYLQNKGWNPSVELLQCFTELKESSMLPSAAYLQMMASRVALDSQGRLILRENGKIILPFEHFANAVMLKHMNGPHGLHLGVEATVRAVMDSYTIGRDQFGMEKEFIIEVVQNCPNPACRFYKNQMELTQKTFQHLTNPNMMEQNMMNDFPIPIPPNLNSHLSGINAVDLTGQSKGEMLERPKSVAPTQQQITAALIQQQNRVLAQNMEKQRQIQIQQQQQVQQQQQQQQQQQTQVQQQVQQQQQHQQQQQSQKHFEPQLEHKLTDFLRANLDSLEGLSSSNKDLLALHNGAWNNDEKRNNDGGQEKIVRAFGEVMKNMARMKTYVRPAMCKPYGKQSEALQKTLMDTIQLIQSLRSFLPPPHIQVSSWKNEDKHRFEET